MESGGRDSNAETYRNESWIHFGYLGQVHRPSARCRGLQWLRASRGGGFRSQGSGWTKCALHAAQDCTPVAPCPGGDRRCSVRAKSGEPHQAHHVPCAGLWPKRQLDIEGGLRTCSTILPPGQRRRGVPILQVWLRVSFL